MSQPRFLPRLAPDERARFYLTAIAFMCVASAALVARAIGDALFLADLGSAPLPFMYIGGALVTGLGAYACARASGRWSTAAVNVFVAVLLIAANAGVFALLGLFPTLSRVAAYLIADVAGRLPILLIWGLAGEVFDARESRRLFGLIGAAGTAACLPAGLLVGPFASRFGTAAGTLVTGALMAGAILAIVALARRSREAGPWRTAPARTALVTASARSARHLNGNGAFVTLSALAAVTALVQTLVDYQFKATFAPLAKDAALAALFGSLYATTSVVALLLQLFLVHRILQRGGVLLSLCILPAALIAGSAAILRAGSAAAVFVTKAIDVTLTLTINGAARQMLYRGIRSESRLQARALAEGLYQPVAVGFAGAVLAVAMGYVTIRAAALATIVGCVLWLLTARTACSAYVAGLLDSIRGRRFESDDEPFTAREPALEGYVRETLAKAGDAEVVYLCGVLHQLGDFTGVPELRAALERESPRVKVAVLGYLHEHGLSADSPALEHLAGHADPLVRRAAVRCVRTAMGERTIAWMRARLEDPDPGVRAAAAAALVNAGPPDAAASGYAVIRGLAGSAAAGARMAAAEALADAGPGGVTPLLVRLLESPEEEVLLAALDSCRRHPDSALVSAILPHLERPRTVSAAAGALLAVGPAALEALVPALEAATLGIGPAAAGKIPDVLARIGDPRALPALRRRLGRLDPADRAGAVRAYVALVKRQRTAAPYLGEAEDLIAAEIRSAEARVQIAASLGSPDGGELLRHATLDLARAHVRNAFLLLDLFVQEADMPALHSTLEHGTREARSQAIELLQNVLPEKVKAPLLGLLDRAAAPPVPRGPVTAAALGPLLEDAESEWIVTGALAAAGRLRIAPLAPAIRRRLGHPSPIVRETALWALGEVETREAFMEACLPMTRDPDATVRELALSISRSGSGRAPGPC